MSSPSSCFSEATREKWFPKKSFETNQAEGHSVSATHIVSMHPVDAFLDQLRMSWVEEWQEVSAFRCDGTQVGGLR
jgi:hypothetical protein